MGQMSQLSQARGQATRPLVAFCSHFGLPHGDLAPQLFTQAAVSAEFSTAEVAMYEAEKKHGELRSELVASRSCK